MRGTAWAGLLLGTLVAAPVPPAAAAEVHVQGARCQAEWTISGGTVVAELSGGPLLLLDGADLTPRRGALTCSLTYATRGHTDPTIGSVTGPTTTGVLAAPPTVVTAAVPPTELPYVAVCTRVDVEDGPTLYWDDHNRGSSNGEWTTSPGADCSGGPQALDCCYIPGSDEAEWAVEVLDPVLCAPLAALFPPHGDVAGLWDCPPYGS